MEDRSVSDVDTGEPGVCRRGRGAGGLLERYRPSLYAAAIGMLRGRDDALDAVQETCVIALVKLGSLRDPAAVGGWLHRVLRNVVPDPSATASTRAEATDVEVPVPPGPEEVIDQLALRDWVWDGIDTLSPRPRHGHVALLQPVQSYEAIAAVIGVPVGTVRSRLNRARSQLATRAEQHTVGRRSRTRPRATGAPSGRTSTPSCTRRPVPRTYRDTYAPDVEVTDRDGRWQGRRGVVGPRA